MEKIAIIGMGCLFPGSRNPEEFWDLLIQNKNAITEYTKDDLGKDPSYYFNPQRGKSGKISYLKKGIVRNFNFNPKDYSLPEDKLQKLDDIFKWMLYVTKQSLEDSGYEENKEIREKTGIIVANLVSPTNNSRDIYLSLYNQIFAPVIKNFLNLHDSEYARNDFSPSISSPDASPMSTPGLLASYAFGLRGPCFTIDAACASSLYVLKLASYYLLSGEADMMLAGAICKPEHIIISNGFSVLQACPPPDGKCIPLDTKSQGLVVGEGAGMFVLKRLQDAIRDKDKIHAVIENIGCSSDGAGKHIFVPNVKGQVIALQRAYAGTDSKEIDYIECHGTGTIVGDHIELESLESFFSDNNTIPFFGANKGNIGHLLVASGMCSMIKVIMSINKGIIPATIDISDPLHTPKNIFNKDKLITKNHPWPETSKPKRAGINAFGFGGVNAHIILQEYKTNAVVAQASKNNFVHDNKMAIIGMGIYTNGVETLNDFNRAIYEQKQNFTEIPNKRWIDDKKYNYEKFLHYYNFSRERKPYGAFIDYLDFDCNKFRIPPKEAHPLLFHQFIMLHVVEQALKDASFANDVHKNVAVLIGLEFDPTVHNFYLQSENILHLKTSFEKSNINLTDEQFDQIAKILEEEHSIIPVSLEQISGYISNIVANRISSYWDFNGPSFVIASQENSIYKCLQVAQFLLAFNELDAVIVGSFNNNIKIENIISKNILNHMNTGAISLSYDSNVTGWTPGEGAGAIILKRFNDVVKDNNRYYATIDSLAILESDKKNYFETKTPSSDNVMECCKKALTKTHYPPEDISYIEVNASGIYEQDLAEIQGLKRIYSIDNRFSPCIMGSVKSNFGHTFAASGIFSIIKTALCLYYAYVPGTPLWKEANFDEITEAGPFNVLTGSRYWYNIKKRIAAISSLGADHACVHVILAEPELQHRKIQPVPKTLEFHLMPIIGASQNEIIQQLDLIQKKINEQQSLNQLAYECYTNYSKRLNEESNIYTVSIVGKNANELLQEITNAYSGIAQVFKSGGEWATKSGSYFTSCPLGRTGKIAFVYPLAELTSTAQAEKFIITFPEIITIIDEYLQLTDAVYHERYKNILMEDKQQQLPFVFEYFTSKITTAIALKYLQIIPDIACGCSLGEFAMLNAFDVIIFDTHQKDNYYLDIVIPFASQLSDPELIKKYYKDEPIRWSNFYLRAPVDKVREMIAGNQKIFISIICSPEDLFISGNHEDCVELISQLKGTSLPISNDRFTHTPLAMQLYETAMSLTEKLSTDAFHIKGNNGNPIFYSAARLAPLPLVKEEIMKNSLDCLCKQVDFVAIIKKIYDEGTRIFIDMGPHDYCTGWINTTLQDVPHVAISLHKSDKPIDILVASIMAILVSHQVKCNISSLYQQESITRKAKPFIKRIENGVDIDIFLNEFKQRFEKVLTTINEFVNPKIPDLKIGNLESSPYKIDKTERGTPSFMNSSHQAYYNLVQKVIKQNAYAHMSYLKLQEMYYQKMTDYYSFTENGDVKTILYDKTQSYQPYSSYNQDQNAFFQPAMPSAQVIIKDETDGLSKMKNEMPSPKIRKNHQVNKENIALWDEHDILEMADGKLSNILGSEYAEIDTYPVRSRVPLPPFCFVSRVLKIDATKHQLKSCMIEWEYDIPHDAYFILKNNQVAPFIIAESSHAVLLLYSYIGIDLMYKGRRHYRIADAIVTYHDEIPLPGETFKGIVHVESFTNFENMLIISFDYKCYVHDKLFLHEKGTGGFFSERELHEPKGILSTNIEQLKLAPYNEYIKNINIQYIDNNFDKYLQAFLESMHPMLRMLDRILLIDTHGGIYEKGIIIAEKEISPEHWVFRAHFKNDPVFPGSLLLEGCQQALFFYLINIFVENQLPGNEKSYINFKGIIIKNSSSVAKFRGQVKCAHSKVIYRSSIKDLQISEKSVQIWADTDIIYEDMIIATLKNLSMGIKAD